MSLSMQREASEKWCGKFSSEGLLPGFVLTPENARDEKDAKSLQRPPFFSTLHLVMKFKTAAIILGVFLFANALISVARADESKPGLQTELTDTTISGYVDASADIGVGAPSDLSASFSVSTVPEPSSICLFATGVLAFAAFGTVTRRHFGHLSKP